MIKKGDILKFKNYSGSRKVLAVCDDLYGISYTNDYDNFCIWATQKDIEQDFDIPKEAWVPKDGEYYFYVTSEFIVDSTSYRETWESDRIKVLLKNCFKTREEAEAMAEKFKALLAGSSMTTQEKITAIRLACIEANESIKDLVFGCLVCAEDNVVHFVLGKEANSDAVYTVVHHKDFAKLHKYRLTPSKFEIIGRPIRLADVLLAVGKKDGAIMVCERTDRGILVSNELSEVLRLWNFEKDDLNLQSRPTIAFIAELLK